MRDYINIGCTPYEEQCTPVGSENYNKLARVECSVFLNQCKRALLLQFGEDYTIDLRIKSFSHDYGTYHEVVAYYDENDMEQALYLEGEADLSHWDNEALKELSEHGYSL